MIETLEPLKQDAKVLVAGLIPGNLPTDMTNDDRVIIWETEEAGRKNAIPAGVSIVLTTRFVRHITTERLKVMCRKQGVVFETRLYTIGMLRQALRVLLGSEAPTPVDAIINAPEPDTAPLTASLRDRVAGPPTPHELPTPIPEPTKPMKYRSVFEVIRAELPENHAHRSWVEWSKVFRPRLEQLGFTPTEKSLQQTLSAVGKERKAARQKVQLPAPASQPPVVAESKVLDEKPKPKKGQTLIGDTGGHAEILRMIDDMIAAAHLIRERMVALEDSNATLAARHRRLLAALEEEA